MAEVYKVRNIISQQLQAMKIMLPDLAGEADFSARFIREIQVLATLDHSGIARLHTALRIENQLVMIMELVEGITLEDLLKQGRIPLPDGVDYICQVLAALSYAHRKGVIHRDIKPANMMLTSQGTIKLMDFGIAKAPADRKLTKTGNIIGSLHYMSPEQVMGSDLDARSDLYSVGICLYEIVTGARPFHADSDYTLMERQLRQPPQPPIQKDANIPPALNGIILRALEKDPVRRFQTAEEFWAALASVVKDRRMPAATGWLEPPGTQAPPAEPSGLWGINAPPVATAPLPQPAAASLPKADAPTSSRRRLYIALGAVLTTALAVVLAIELQHPNHRPDSKPQRVEELPKKTSSSLDQTLHFPSGDMVLVPGGEAKLGKDGRVVNLQAFYIDKTEVTNRAYLLYCHEAGLPEPAGANEALDYPVVNVTFYDAQKFATWATKRLPTAEEWEKAARGTDGRPYPWGDIFDSERANIPKDKAAARSAALAPAAAYPSGRSPYGALNMLGNAWEWVNTPAEVPEGDEFEGYQREGFPNLHPALSRTEPYYQIRGGSFRFVPDDPTALIWDSSPAPERAATPQIGFRCAKSVDR
jgi:serine/threonine-protein kinase